MKRSKFSDVQILAIVMEARPIESFPTCVAPTGSPSRHTTGGRPSTAGWSLSEMQRLKELEDENRRLKQIVAEQTLDIQALKAVVAKMVNLYELDFVEDSVGRGSTELIVVQADL